MLVIGALDSVCSSAGNMWKTRNFKKTWPQCHSSLTQEWHIDIYLDYSFLSSIQYTLATQWHKKAVNPLVQETHYLSK